MEPQPTLAQELEDSIVAATVVRLTEAAAIVSFGPAKEGEVSFAEFAKIDGKPQVTVGDRFEVLVEPSDSGLAVSKDKAEKLRRFDEVAARCKKGAQVEGMVVARVNGGFSVDVGMRAFLPSADADLKRVSDPEALLGQTLTFRVLEFDKRRGNIVLSRRTLLETELKAKKADTLARLAEGAVFPGVVKTLTDYGAFVDLGGMDGLLHVSELSWGRVAHPKDVLSVGQEVTVKVVKLDATTGKIGLSLRQLQEDPWARAEEKYAAGVQVTGKVVGFATFGAFVQVEPGLEGLVHVSEMSWTRRVQHPQNEVKLGDEVKAVVLSVEAKTRRLSLGMRQLQANPWDQLVEQYPIGTVLRSRVRSVTDFGVFLGVLEGIDGIVHISDLSWTQKVKHPGELYKKGDEVEAVVLNVDVENERLSLGIKQLTTDPWQVLADKHPIGAKVSGTVTRVAAFGVFVELEPGIEGLIHVSELREERTENAADLYSAGDAVEAQVLDIDARGRRISLSIRALSEASGADYRAFLDRDEGKASLGDVLGDKLKK